MSSVRRGSLIVVGLVAILSEARNAGATVDEAIPRAPHNDNDAAAEPPASPDSGATPAVPVSPPSDAAVATAPAPPPPAALPPPKTAAPAPVLVSQASRPAEQPSIARRPWFWITIGAVVAAGVVGGFLLFRGSPKDPTASLGSVDGNGN